MTKGPHLLIVEDNEDLARLVDQNLRFEGFSTRVVHDGSLVWAALREQPTQLIILDLMLPTQDGFSVLRQLRDAKDPVPVLMLTARGDEADRVRGLALGADDYLVKPFSMLELIERVKAILRRTRQAVPKVYVSGPLRIDTHGMVATLDGQRVALTGREYRILEVLLMRAGSTLSRRELLSHAWEPDACPTPRTVDSHIGHLRRKLCDDDTKGWIVTVGGEGYRWTLQVQPAGDADGRP